MALSCEIVQTAQRRKSASFNLKFLWDHVTIAPEVVRKNDRDKKLLRSNFLNFPYSGAEIKVGCSWL